MNGEADAVAHPERLGVGEIDLDTAADALGRHGRPHAPRGPEKVVEPWPDRARLATGISVGAILALIERMPKVITHSIDGPRPPIVAGSRSSCRKSGNLADEPGFLALAA